jgi:hypothetical protein
MSELSEPLSLRFLGGPLDGRRIVVGRSVAEFVCHEPVPAACVRWTGEEVPAMPTHRVHRYRRGTVVTGVRRGHETWILVDHDVMLHDGGAP